jgi:hypothetical protein
VTRVEEHYFAACVRAAQTMILVPLLLLISLLLLLLLQALVRVLVTDRFVVVSSLPAVVTSSDTMVRHGNALQ